MNSGIRQVWGSQTKFLGFPGPAARVNQRGYLSRQGIQIVDDLECRIGRILHLGVATNRVV